MKILIAPDKFKGSVQAAEICHILKSKFLEQNKSLDIITHPMADGGDGSIAILKEHLSLQEHTCITVDPLGRKLTGNYWTEKESAFIELAQSSGLVLLSENERNPLKTSTYGTGLIIKHAVKSGYKNIYLLLGGSATNDGGTGIAHALGWEFIKKDGSSLFPNGENLAFINSIEPNASPLYKEIKIHMVCDVKNEFAGHNGAAYIYAKQKGASESDIVKLDNGLLNLADQIVDLNNIDVVQLKGAGAAGGIAGGLYGLLNATIINGFSFISKITNLEQKIINCDFIISGEGRIDNQTTNGKVVGEISQLSKKHNKKLILIGGDIKLKGDEIGALGAMKTYSITERSHSLKDAMANTNLYLNQIADELFNDFLS